MSNEQTKLQQQFEQLPDPEPPLGLDTRIKAHARSQLENQRSQRGKRRRWNTALASVGCAAIAFVIAKPFFQDPLLISTEQQPKPHSTISEVDGSAQTDRTLPDNSLLEEPASSLGRSVAPISTIDGGGSSPESKLGKRLVKESLDLKQSYAEPTKAQEPEHALELMATPLDLTDEAIPKLQELLEQLEKAKTQQAIDKTSDIEALIKKYYPDYEFD